MTNMPFVSVDLSDQDWDRFLESTPHGQFQQSSCWACAKAVEGWRAIRAAYSDGGRIIGGFQILCRASRLGRMGFLPKGPVTVDERALPLDGIVRRVIAMAKDHGLAAIVVQPAEKNPVSDSLFAGYGFSPNILVPVVARTHLLDLSCGMDKIISNMRRTHSLNIRQARSRGLKIREGSAGDIDLFFRLMVSTCERQEKRPIPSTAAGLLRVWNAFHERHLIRLNIAEADGKAIAAGLTLLFGKRATLWKKGWSGEGNQYHPNNMVTFEAIEWAQQRGFETFDFADMALPLADTLLSGGRPTEEMKRCVSFFNLGYGGYSLRVPDAFVHIRNPVLRFVYRRGAGVPWMRKLARAVLER